MWDLGVLELQGFEVWASGPNSMAACVVEQESFKKASCSVL